MKKFIFLFLSIFTIIHAQGTWLMSGRVHPELKWQTISTKHFNIHYHQGIESIGEEGAVIAEHVRPILLEQMDIDTIPTTLARNAHFSTRNGPKSAPFRPETDPNRTKEPLSTVFHGGLKRKSRLAREWRNFFTNLTFRAGGVHTFGSR